MRSHFDDKRDMAIANDHGDRSKLMCGATGCPNIWTLDSSKLCRWHSAAPAHQWPVVTQELLEAVTDAVLERQRPKPVAPPLSRADKTAILQKMRGLFVTTAKDPKAWAKALQEREQSGERLSSTQRTMYRAALGPIPVEVAE